MKKKKLNKYNVYTSIINSLLWSTLTMITSSRSNSFYKFF
jgi:hypothetical protein